MRHLFSLPSSPRYGDFWGKDFPWVQGRKRPEEQNPLIFKIVQDEHTLTHEHTQTIKQKCKVLSLASL